MSKPSDFHPRLEKNCFCGQSLTWNPGYKADKIRNAVVESSVMGVPDAKPLSHCLKSLGNPKASGYTS